MIFQLWGLPRGAIPKVENVKIYVYWLEYINIKNLTDMTKRNLNKWIMYNELHKFKRLGFSNAKIAQHLVMDARTARKYLNMGKVFFTKV